MLIIAKASFHFSIKSQPTATATISITALIITLVISAIIITVRNGQELHAHAIQVCLTAIELSSSKIITEKLRVRAIKCN